MIHQKQEERGFILVTSLILLSILMILGGVSFFKSNVEIKVSQASLETEQALVAMNAGLNRVYADWIATPGGEFKNLADWVGKKAGAAPSIYVESYPLTVANLNGVPPAGARVYTLQPNGTLTTGTAWGTGRDPQVAIWVTSFLPPTGVGYPYDLTNNAYYVKAGLTNCDSCNLVVYALGRSGDAIRLGREYMSNIDTKYQAFGAMVNAPKYRTLLGRCNSNPAVGSFWGSDLTAGSIATHMIDATQAPGGVAMASNNGVNISNTSKPYPNNTGTSLKGIDPWVVYDPGKVITTDYPKINGDTMSALSATAVKQNLQGTPDEMKYFSGADSQLFNLDAYREAANRIAGFADENIAGTVVSTGGATLGNYATLVTAGNHRMGTLQWPEVDYNIRNQIPMYGLVRMMIPMHSPSAQNCGSIQVNKFKIAHDPMPPGRLIVYGGALFDFFWDKNGNDLYEPNLPAPDTERLLTPTESLISKKFNVDTHIAFNPVMDAMSPKSTGPSMNAVGVPGILEVNTYPVGSPTWDLATDALPGSDGAVDILDNIWNVGHNWSTQVHNGAAGPAGYTFPGFSNGMWNLTGSQKQMLDYYIRTTSNASKVNWSDRTVADIEANYLTFKIQTQADTVDSESSADLFHSFLPSGYIHGWKRAIAVTGLGAAPTGGTSVDNETIWSEDLLPVGSQFYDSRHKYFFLTRDNATGKVYIDKQFADIPAEMYAGGLVDMHQHSNTSGVTYTPDQLELELKNIVTNARQYLNGIVITGAGVFMKDETGGVGRAIIAYDDTSIDNLPVNNQQSVPERKYFQELK